VKIKPLVWDPDPKYNPDPYLFYNSGSRSVKNEYVSETLSAGPVTGSQLRTPKSRKGKAMCGPKKVKKPTLTGEMLSLLAMNHLYPHCDHERGLYSVDHIVAFISLHFPYYNDLRTEWWAIIDIFIALF